MSNGAWLTKSRFLAGKQCPKRLWQQCHSPLEEGNEPSPITEKGIRVGRLAHQLFPDGAVAWTEGQTVSQAIAANLGFRQRPIRYKACTGGQIVEERLRLGRAVSACRTAPRKRDWRKDTAKNQPRAEVHGTTEVVASGIKPMPRLEVAALSMTGSQAAPLLQR
jgi:hypothetical protein